MALLRSRRGPPGVFRGSGVLRIGQLIDDRYEVVEVLADGATAAIARVKHRVLGRTFALKALRTEAHRDAEFHERFRREGRALAALNHPNIVAITDSGQLPGGEPYFVMEHLEGVALDTLLSESGRLDVALAVDIALGICAALAAAHMVGIVHRDLKPANVYIASSGGHPGRVKVLDFGLARRRGDGRVTHPDAAPGTPEYMSPEQATGRGADARSDIYALGVTLYELLCGRPPFRANSYIALAHQHIHAPPPPFRQWLGGNCPSAKLEGVVMRCLEKDPGARFASVADVERVLASHAVPEPTLRLHSGGRATRAVLVSGDAVREPPSSFVRVARAVRLQKVGLWIVIGCAIGAVGLVLFAALFGVRNGGKPP